VYDFGERGGGGDGGDDAIWVFRCVENSYSEPVSGCKLSERHIAFVVRDKLISTEVVVCPFEMFVTTYQNTRCNFPENQSMNLILPFAAAGQIFSCETLIKW